MDDRVSDGSTTGLLRWEWRPYSLAAVIGLIVLGGIVLLRPSQDWDTVYLPAAQKLLKGEDIYQQEGFVYPPVNAWLGLPFVGLSHWPARALWGAINLTALAILIGGAWNLSGGGRLEGVPRPDRREHWIFVIGLGCGISSCIDALTNQQTDLIVAALVILGCLALTKQRDLRASLWFGVAAGMKCTPLLWAAYLGWRRRWIAAALVFVVAGAVNVIPDLIHPPANSTTRLGTWASRFLLPMAERKHEYGTWACGVGGNQSIAGLWQRWLTYEASWNGEDIDFVQRSGRASPEMLKAVTWSTLLALLAIGLVCAWKSGRIESVTAPSVQAVEFGMILMLMVLLSPHTSKPHFCTLLLPGFTLARAALIGSNRWLWLLLVPALLCVLPANKDLVGDQLFAWGKWHGCLTWCSIFLYIGSCWTLLRQGRPATTSITQAAPESVSWSRAA